jgi:protein O-mannosyl-transferase
VHLGEARAAQLSPGVEGDSRRTYERLALVALACLPFLVSLRGGFVYDDVPLVQHDPRVRDGDLQGALTEPYWGDRHGGLFRPVTTASFVLNGLVTQEPWLFRATNIGLHAGATLLSYALARRLLGARRPAFLAAAVFAVHPIHAEVAANVVGRAESLAFLLTGGAWFLVLDATHRVRPRWLPATALLATLGVLSKESAVVLTLAAPVEVLLFASRPRARQMLLAALPGVAAVVCGLAARIAILGSHLLTPQVVDVQPNPLADASLAERLADVPVLLLFYLRNLAYPFSLSPDYGGTTQPLDSATPLVVIGRLVLASAVLFLPALAGGRRLVFAVLFLLLALLPVLQLVPIGTLAGDRLAYSASFGFALALGVLIEALFRRVAARKAALLAAALLASFAFTSADDAHAWSDPVRLFERARARTPASSQVHYVLGMLYLQRGESARAIEPLESALTLSPADGNVMRLLGQVHAELGQLERARELLERALVAGVWEPAKARVQLGLVRMQLGDLVGAEREFRSATELAPRDGDILLRLGQVERQLGRLEEARAVFEHALALEPLDHLKGRVQLALVLGELGDLAGAERELRGVIELDPDMHWYLALGEVLQARGDPRAARIALERGIALDPTAPLADELRRRLDAVPP